MIVIEINTQMRNDSTYGLSFLNPIETSSAIMLTLYYLSQSHSNVDILSVNDKLSQLDPIDKNSSDPNKPTLSFVETIFQKVSFFHKMYNGSFVFVR